MKADLLKEYAELIRKCDECAMYDELIPTWILYRIHELQGILVGEELPEPRWESI